MHSPYDRDRVICLEFTPRLLSEFRSIVERSMGYRVSNDAESTGISRHEKAIVVRQCLKRFVPANAPKPAGSHKRQHSFALINLGLSTARAEVYSQGYSDYIAYPFVTSEIQHRFSAARALMKQNVSAEYFSKDTLVNAACNFLSTEPEFAGGIDALAQVVGSNRNTLSKRFKEEFGVGPMAWFRRYRLNYAAALVLEGQHSIQDIAFKVGYEDANNFSTAFKREFDVSPSEYRRYRNSMN